MDLLSFRLFTISRRILFFLELSDCSSVRQVCIQWRSVHTKYLSQASDDEIAYFIDESQEPEEITQLLSLYKFTQPSSFLKKGLQMKKNFKCLDAILVFCKHEIDQRDRHDETVLHYAAIQESTEIFLALYYHSKDPWPYNDLFDKYGFLHFCHPALKPLMETIRILNCKNNDPYEILQVKRSSNINDILDNASNLCLEIQNSPFFQEAFELISKSREFLITFLTLQEFILDALFKQVTETRMVKP